MPPLARAFVPPLPFLRAPPLRPRLSPPRPAMVVTPSTMLPLGTPAPPFALPEPLTGATVSLPAAKGPNATLVVFMCNHCPFVVMLQNQLRALGADLKPRGVAMLGISSNDAADYPDDGPDAMKTFARTKFDSFTYLYDQTQDVAKSYRAACTPDAYLFDKDLKLVYRGQIDDSRPGNGKPSNGKSIRDAVDLVLDGKPVPEEAMKGSIGCNIKWRKGNEPDYFG